MQPFGLLNFLQTLLNSSQQNPDVSPPLSSQESATDTEEKDGENNQIAPNATGNQKAILSFYDAHERRAKNVRK